MMFEALKYKYIHKKFCLYIVLILWLLRHLHVLKVFKVYTLGWNMDKIRVYAIAIYIYTYMQSWKQCAPQLSPQWRLVATHELGQMMYKPPICIYMYIYIYAT